MLPLLIMLRRCLLKCRCNVYVVCVCVCVCVCLLCVIRFIVYVPNVVRNKSHYYYIIIQHVAIVGFRLELNRINMS